MRSSEQNGQRERPKDPWADSPWLKPDETPFIRIENVSKMFGDFRAVDDVSLSIYRGELFSILGGSGCGKTTLLRMLAGFELPSEGRILIDGKDVTRVPAYERPVNMMFQSYALFPHMTVEGNIAYGLKRDAMSRSAIRERVNEMLQLVQLTEFRTRKPNQLSGGQRQRVALARALAKRPKVLLLDEPLAALDKKLREQTQFELANIQDKLGVTFVVVTHDQEEAMTLSSRIAVMKNGRFVQVGTPHEVYENPADTYTADFVGNINLFSGMVTAAQDGQVTVDLTDFPGGVTLATHQTVRPGTEVSVALRPEKIFVTRDRPDDPKLMTAAGIIFDQGYFGKLSVFRVQIDSQKIVQVSAQNRIRFSKRAWDWDEHVFLSWDPQSMLVLAS